MKIQSLVDDISTDNGLINEHGLSFYLEDGAKKYLFDTGASDVFLQNAEKLGLDIKNIDALFISHNHYDHIGGLLDFMEINDKAKIYIKKNAIYETYYQKNKIKCPVGQHHKEVANSKRIVFVEDNMQIDNIHLVSDTNGDKRFFCQGNKFLMEKEDMLIEDEFTHEMFLVYIKDDKANIISACSHRGIINIIETTKKTFSLPINSVTAGFHLAAKNGTALNCTPEYYDNLVKYFNAQNIEHLYTCHCTGKYAYDKLKDDLGEKLKYFCMGDELIF